MKKCWVILGLALVLSGCGAQPVMETVADGVEQPVMAQPQKILLTLPEDAQVPTLQTQDGSQLYVCEDFTVSTYILPARSMDSTLKTVTGRTEEELCVIGSYAPEGDCRECAWTAVGEGEMVLGNARIISDGSYHYAVAVLAPETGAAGSAEVIRSVLNSFALEAVSTEP